MDAFQPEFAVVVEHAYKKYGGQAVPWVLKNLNMSIPRNQIYGLLGSSGCGKTTLLKSLVGAQSLDYGSIELTVKSKKEVGFMPQETALFDEFTIAETFQFYASLYQLSRDQFRSRVKELSDVLDLPPDDRICSTLSGGQVRRVSIAVTLLHHPSLVILDEPTSGLDPLLANTFWRYLNRLAVQGQTIVVTTHYIEEARQANVVGLMRHGVLLAESPPEKLITQHGVDSLEDVFLCLCNQQIKEDTTQYPALEKKIPFIPMYQDRRNTLSESWAHIKAILFKNVKWVQRNIVMFTLLSFVLSISCVVESNECLKFFPPMRIGIVNHGIHGTCANYTRAPSCDEKGVDLSCQFIQAWRTEKPEMEVITYDHMDAAMRDGKSRRLISIFEIPSNFTAGVLERFTEGWKADTQLLDSASIDVRIDSTDFMGLFKLEQDVRDVMESMFRKHLQQCGYNPSVADIPPMIINRNQFLGEGVVFQPYDYTTHISMAIICATTFMGPIVLLTMSLCLEKMTGAYTRCLVGGVQIREIHAGYLIMLTLFNFTNSGLMLFFQYVIYAKPHGTFWLGCLLINVIGLTGIFYGLMVVTITKSLTENAGVAIVTSLSMYSFTGFIWPIEASVLTIIQPLSRIFFPTTLGLKAIFAIIWKDASFWDKQVQYGFLVSIVHSLVYLGITVVLVKWKKSL